MSDPALTLPTTPAIPKPSPGAQKSPLDVLEDILKDAKGGAEAVKVQEVADQAVQAEEKQKEELVALQEQQKLEDQQQIQQHLVAMQTVKESPEEIERQRQEQAKKQTHQQQMTADGGFEVVQLDHTKI